MQSSCIYSQLILCLETFFLYFLYSSACKSDCPIFLDFPFTKYLYNKSFFKMRIMRWKRKFVRFCFAIEAQTNKCFTALTRFDVLLCLFPTWRQNKQFFTPRVQWWINFSHGHFIKCCFTSVTKRRIVFVCSVLTKKENCTQENEAIMSIRIEVKTNRFLFTNT